MRKTHTLSDGRKCVTSSKCRYVLFTEFRGEYTVCRRSDNVSRLFAEVMGTDVIVDFNAEGGSRVVTPPSTNGQRRPNAVERKIAKALNAPLLPVFDDLARGVLDKRPRR